MLREMLQSSRSLVVLWNVVLHVKSPKVEEDCFVHRFHVRGGLF
jgi:hypothetical protein